MHASGRESRGLGVYALLAPLLVLTAVFGVYPALQSLWLTVHRTDGPEVVAFIGIENIQRLAGDPRFYRALANTAVFVAGSLVVQVPLALGLALYVNPIGRARRARAGRNSLSRNRLVRTGLGRTKLGRSVLRAVVVVPHLVGPPFAAVLFTVVLGSRSGALNGLLAAVNHAFPGLGIPDETRWLSDPALILPVTLAIAAWLGTGLNLLLLGAALRAVDAGLYEAARLDGAGAWRRFVSVTLPGIAPVLVFVCVLDCALAVRVFDMPWILLGGTAGPEDAGLFLTTYLYETGFVQGDLGYASAIGWVLTVAMVGVALLQRGVGARLGASADREGDWG